jgi:hypothetical protein
MSTDPPTLVKSNVAASGIDHDALPPGTRFGEFEIIRVLGVGGFGIVYLANDHSLEREVALKEYMPASLAARGAGPQITVRSSSFAETYAIGLRSFVNEARLLARFDHPSLVKVYRFWEDNATAYMVMPFLQGTTLRDTRRGMAHSPDEAWVRSVITPILSALELLHREGVYHRDIAPDNILLPREGPPVLLDFGAARRVISDRTQSLTAILKPSYAPIEQYAEMTQLRQGPWTDLYALGAVVHYLLFGVPPAPATARAVQDDGDAIETRIVPGVSPRFLEAMSWMLAIRPNQRPQSGEQLRAVLDGLAEIPPRARLGTTIPGAVAQAAAAAARPLEQGAEATRVNTAFVPTYMPTARVGAPVEPMATTFSPTAAMPTARLPQSTTVPDVRPPPPRSPAPPSAGLASRPAPLGAAGAGRTTIVAPPARPVPLPAPAAPVRAGGSSKIWLAAAGGAAVVIAAVAAWQFSPRREASPVEPVEAAASLAASSVAVVPAPVLAPVLPAPVPAAVTPTETAATPMPVATPSGAVDETRPTATRTPAADAGPLARPPIVADRDPPLDGALATAASAVRVRPAGRPVPRVADNAASANASPTRLLDTAALGAPAIGGDRTRPPVAAPSRDPIVVPHAVPPVVQAGPATAREACGKRVFIALAVCMDERCEEARYRATPECVTILARKAAREMRP